LNILRSVWIVDDDPISRLLIKKTLERAHSFGPYREFSDGSELIDILNDIGHLNSDIPNLIFLDINMPEKNGWDVLDFIKEKKIPLFNSQIVLLSSSINQNDKIRAYTYESIRLYLQKPLAQDDLASLNL